MFVLGDFGVLACGLGPLMAGLGYLLSGYPTTIYLDTYNARFTMQKKNHNQTSQHTVYMKLHRCILVEKTLAADNLGSSVTKDTENAFQLYRSNL